MGAARPAAHKKTVIATEQDAADRAAWRGAMAGVAAEMLVFLDETSTQTVMTRRTGRAPRGQRVVGRVPHHHGPNVTCLAALSPTGIQAPCVVERALDGARLLHGVREWLRPILHPGTTIVLDTLRVHRSPDVRDAVEADGGHLCYRPASSPDVTPIEHVFAQLKRHLRGAGARAFDALVEAIGAGLAQISSAHLRASYRHCGYPLSDPNPQPTCNPL